MSHRQAYFPRKWPPLLGGLLVAGALSSGLWLAGVRASSALGGFGLGVLIGGSVGAIVGKTVLGRWRRKHPVLEVEEIVDRQQQAAKWN